MLLEYDFATIPAKPLQPQGLFNSSIARASDKSASNAWHRCHHRSLTKDPARDSEPLKKLRAHPKSPIIYLSSTIIPLHHLLNTSPPTIIPDAIRSFQWHSNLMPFTRWHFTDELGRNLLSGTGREGLGEVWEVVDGFGSGSVRVCCGLLTGLERLAMKVAGLVFSTDVGRATLSPACQA